MTRVDQLGWGRALAVVLTAMALVGMAAVPAPARAMPRADADPDAVRTDIIFLTAMSPDRAMALWQHVVGRAPGARIVRGRGAGSIIVRDTAPRLARFRQLLGALDRQDAGAARVFVRPVVHVTPTALSALAREALAARGREAAAVVMVPDDRSGQLVVQATPAAYKLLDGLLRKLDVPPRRR